jgi:hypothetical protein
MSHLSTQRIQLRQLAKWGGVYIHIKAMQELYLQTESQFRSCRNVYHFSKSCWHKPTACMHLLQWEGGFHMAVHG